MGYWDSHGYDNLIDGGDWQGAVNEMRIRMGGSCRGILGGVLDTNISPGIICYAQARGYTFASEWWCDGPPGYGCANSHTYDRYRAEIDAKRPIVVNVFDHDKYGDHSLTGIGYDTNSSYIIVHNNEPFTVTGADVNLQYGSGYYSRILMNSVVPIGGSTCPRKGKGDANCDGEIDTGS